MPRGPHKLRASLKSSSVSRDSRIRRERLRSRRTESASRPGQVHTDLVRVLVGSFVSDVDQKHPQDALGEAFAAHRDTCRLRDGARSSAAASNYTLRAPRRALARLRLRGGQQPPG